MKIAVQTHDEKRSDSDIGTDTHKIILSEESSQSHLDSAQNLFWHFSTESSDSTDAV